MPRSADAADGCGAGFTGCTWEIAAATAVLRPTDEDLDEVGTLSPSPVPPYSLPMHD